MKSKQSMRSRISIILRSFGLSALLSFTSCSPSSGQFQSGIAATCQSDDALVIVIDKSRSLDEHQLVAGEKRALLEVVPKLKSDVCLSIIAFDVIPLLVAKNLKMNDAGKSIALERISRIFGARQTMPIPAIMEALRILKTSTSRKKSMIFMSDSKFTFSTSVAEFREIFSDTRVDKLSVIALFGKGDKATMRNLARAGGGDFHEINDILQIPIFLGDTLRSWQLLD